MQITTLGPLAVDGRPVRGERLAAVVRELVGARGRVVSTVALTRAVWRDSPPDQAAGALQAIVSRARGLGLPVSGVDGGYRVPAEQVSVDVVEVRLLTERARAALRDGDPGAARRSADEARSYFPEVPELTGDAATRLFADVAVVRAEAGLAGGGPYPEEDLRRLAAGSPPDEPAAALLVRSLAAQGRDAEALELVETLRAGLADRYGKDLAPSVAEAHLALLRGGLKPAAVLAPPSLPGGWRRPRTPLVGRARDVLALTEALADSALVTVVATGGAGKTRLVAEVARRAVAAGRDVRVVELAGLRSTAEVRTAVLGGGDLIVLDNCEHVLDAVAAVVGELFAGTGEETVVLATSRAPLDLPGELVFALRALPDDAAVELLDARARAAGATGDWTAAQAVRLCRRLDNLPLALELAAVRLRHLPIADVLDGLGDRFALLGEALRGLPDRHSTLDAMVDWSYRLLSPDGATLLRRLAVLPSSFTASAAAAVAGLPDVRRGLAELAGQSLLEPADGDRYRMLETVREYADGRLAAAGERDAAMAGLTAWARDTAVAIGTDLDGPDQVAAYTRCAAELDILLAALRWTSDPATVVDVASAVFALWTVQGHATEITARARPLLAARGADRGRLAWVCLYAGLAAVTTGDLRLYLRARRTLRAVPPEAARPAALAAVLETLGAADPGPRLRVAAVLGADPDPYLRGVGMFLRAWVRENAGEPERATEDAERAYGLFEAAGDHWGMGLAAQMLGVRFGAGGRDGADGWLRRGRRHLALVGAGRDAAAVQVALEVRQALAGDPDAAGRLRAALPELTGMDAARARLTLAQLAVRAGRPVDAGPLVEVALAPAIPVPQGRVVFRMAVLLLWLSAAPVRPATEARAAELLALARADVLTCHDLPVLGCWALGGAALAGYRGSWPVAAELWALGVRLGADPAFLAPQGFDPRLAAGVTPAVDPVARVHELLRKTVSMDTVSM